MQEEKQAIQSNWDKIKPIVEERGKELRNDDSFDPQTLALKIIELSSWWASVNKEVVEREYSFNVLLKELLLANDNVVARAKVHAKATKEYKDWQEALSFSKSIQEIIRGGRRYTRLAEEELRESKF